MAEPAPAIRTRGLTKDYGQGHGVFELDLEIDRGEIFGFLGPNGAGKTTAMRMLVGLISPTAGGAEVIGHDISDGSLDVLRRIGYLAGDFGLVVRNQRISRVSYPTPRRRGRSVTSRSSSPARRHWMPPGAARRARGAPKRRGNARRLRGHRRRRASTSALWRCWPRSPRH